MMNLHSKVPSSACSSSSEENKCQQKSLIQQGSQDMNPSRSSSNSSSHHRRRRRRLSNEKDGDRGLLPVLSGIPEDEEVTHHSKFSSLSLSSPFDHSSVSLVKELRERTFSCWFYLVLVALLQMARNEPHVHDIIQNKTNENPDLIQPKRDLASSASASLLDSSRNAAAETAGLRIDQEHPVYCTKNNHYQYASTYDYNECCGTWNVNADDWWLHHPEFEVAMENDTHFCFRPLPNATQRSFIREVHQRQFYSNCSDVEKTVVLNSGFGTTLNWEMHTFWHAHKRQKPFQLIHGNRKWLYATTNQSHWAYCESHDSRYVLCHRSFIFACAQHTLHREENTQSYSFLHPSTLFLLPFIHSCYYLPVSNCSRNETIRGEHHNDRPRNKYEEHLFHWLKQYSTRPLQHFRQRLYKMRRKDIQMKYPCVAMHVRRGDAGVVATPYRRYAAVQEYIEAANIAPGANILLLTDDESTLEEIQRYDKLLAKRYNWMYLKKKRNRNVLGGFDGHIPTGDEGLEMLAIETEHNLASTCDTFVYGNSGFIGSLLFKLDMEGKKYQKYVVNTDVSKEEARKFKADMHGRIRMFMDDIETYYQTRLNTSGTNTDSLMTKE